MQTTNTDTSAAGVPADLAAKLDEASTLTGELAPIRKILVDLTELLPHGARVTFEHKGLVITAGRNCFETARELQVGVDISLPAIEIDPEVLREALSKAIKLRPVEGKTSAYPFEYPFRCPLGQSASALPAVDHLHGNLAAALSGGTREAVAEIAFTDSHAIVRCVRELTGEERDAFKLVFATFRERARDPRGMTAAERQAEEQHEAEAKARAEAAMRAKEEREAAGHEAMTQEQVGGLRELAWYRDFFSRLSGEVPKPGSTILGERFHLIGRHVAEFDCSIGRTALAEPGGRFLQSLVHTLWRDASDDARPTIQALTIVRKGFKVVTAQPLTEAQHTAIAKLAADYDAAIPKDGAGKPPAPTPAPETAAPAEAPAPAEQPAASEPAPKQKTKGSK